MIEETRYPHTTRSASVWVLGAVYLAAVIIGVEAAGRWPDAHPVVFMFTTDLVATAVVFGFSAWFRNASVYDPYWSVIPVLIVLYWAAAVEPAGSVPLRRALVVTLVVLWGLRLTWNWLRRWRGLGDEDWRYRMLRAKYGHRYWMVNLAGIHLLPTLLVFAACLPAWPALAASERNANWLDGLAFVVTAGSIWIEWRADRQLRAHRGSDSGSLLRSGWWARCRHPNYLGEVGFWWGLYGFALAANPLWWWTGLGPLAITLLFIFVSIPMMDNRLSKKHRDYASLSRELPALLPWPARKTRRNA